MGSPLDEAAQRMVRDSVPKGNHGSPERYHRSRFMDLIAIAAKKDSTLKLMVEKWGSISALERSKYTIDELAHLCGVDAGKVISAASGAAYEMGFGAASLIAMNNFPRVIEKSLESAEILGKEGARDRELLMRHGRFVPVPEGQTINIQNIASAKGGGTLESFEESMKRFGTPAKEEVIEAECTPSE